nr:IS5 family transposase [Labrys wisconsinensis]
MTGEHGTAGEYWLNDRAWASIEPLLPTNYAGARRKDDRRIISGILHVLRCGCRWQDCPAVYGPHTTVYNRFNRWSIRGLWQKIFDALVKAVPEDTRSIDSSSIKVQRSAAGGKGGKAQAIGRSRGGRTTKIHAITDSKGRLFRFLLTPGNVADVTAAYDLTAHLPSKGGLIADMAYDALKLRQELAFRGTASVIPTNPTRKHKWSIDLETYKERNLIERMFCRLKDFRRIATRYDKLARNFASAIALAAVVIWWAD